VEDNRDVYVEYMLKMLDQIVVGEEAHSQNNLFFSFSRDSIQQKKCDFVNVSCVTCS